MTVSPDPIEPGSLVRWTDRGMPHVGRVIAVNGATATVQYGPVKDRYPLASLTHIIDKDGRGNPR
jgi:hypothetical protein